MKQRAVVATTVAVWLAGIGCTAAPPPKPTLVEITGFYKELKSCRDRYAEIDARIDAAGVRDTAFHRVPGFPYLRTDRLTASFRDDTEDFGVLNGWIRRMREFDQEAREFEYQNLGLSQQEAAILRFEFLNCGRGLAGLELENPDNVALVKQLAVPPDDYSDKARTWGFYALTKPLLRADIADHERLVRAEFAKPAEALLDNTPAVRWQVAEVEDLTLIPKSMYDSYPDEFGLPGFVDSTWRALAEANAPQVLTTADATRRQLGAPMWTAQGLDVDTTKPEVNYQIGFTRLGPLNLVQVNYFFWFRTPNAASGTAPVDGLVWRVTLDDHLKPLAYESLRASGRDHFWFPVQQRLARKPASAAAPADEQPAFFPQDGLAPPQALLMLDAVHGGVRRVGAAGTEVSIGSPATPRQYTLKRYEDLYTLPLPSGGTRSPFQLDGLIAGTESDAPGWRLASGITRPGSLRHLSHLPMDYIGRRHFDEPFLMQSAFMPLDLPPPGSPSTKQAADAGRDDAVPLAVASGRSAGR